MTACGGEEAHSPSSQDTSNIDDTTTPADTVDGTDDLSTTGDLPSDDWWAEVGADTGQDTGDACTGSVSFVPPTPLGGSFHAAAFDVAVGFEGDCDLDSLRLETQHGPMESTVDGAFVQTTILPETFGDEALVVTAIATLSSGVALTATRTFVIDTTAPEIVVLSHLEDVTVVMAPTQVISGEVSDPGGEVVELRVSTDGATWVSADVLDPPSWQHTIVLPEGASEVTLVAVDGAGNESPPAVVDLVVDLVPPTIALVDPSPQAGACISGPFTVVAEVADEIGVDTIEVVQPAEGYMATTLEGSLQASFDPALVGEGAATIVIEVTDEAGNVSEVSLDLTIDLTAPEVVVDSPGDGTYVTTTTTELTGHVVDEGCGAATVTIVEAPSVLLATIDLDGQATWSYEASTPSQTNTFLISATDLGGNESEPISYTVNVDDTAPVITWVDPTPPQYACIDGGTTHTLAFTVSDTLGIDVVEVTSPDQGVTLEQGTDGTWTITLDVSSIETAGVLVSLRAVDTLGQEAETSRVYQLDHEDPVVTFTSLGDGDYVNTTTLEVTGTYENPGCAAPESVTMQLDGGAPTTGEFGSSTWEMPLVTLPPTGIAVVPHELSVTMHDAHGNSGTAQATVFLDTEAPLLTFNVTQIPDEYDFYTSTVFVFVAGEDNSDLPLTYELIEPEGLKTTSNEMGINVFLNPSELGDGLITLTASGTDAASNVTLHTEFFTIDTTPPVITIDGLYDGFVTTAEEIEITGHITDNVAGIQSHLTWFDGYDIPTQLDAEGSFSLGVQQLSVGNHLLFVAATDYAGHTTSLSYSITRE